MPRNAGVASRVRCAMKRPPKAQPDLLNEPSRGETHTKWFSDSGCVVDRGARIDVLVWGTLIGSFEKGEVGMRNLVLVTLAANPKMHLGRLAKAFGLSQSGLALIREAYEKGGPQAVLERESSPCPS